MRTTGIRFTKLAIAAISGMILLAGCGIKRPSADELPNEIQSRTGALPLSKTSSSLQSVNRIEDVDGSLGLTFPQGWVRDDNLNKAAVLGVSDRSKEKYCLIVRMPSNLLKDATLDSMRRKLLADTKVALQNYRFVENGDITIDGLPAKTVEFYGTARSVNVRYLAAVLEKDGTFYQIITWSTSDLFAGYKDEFKKVIQSFQIMKPNTKTSVLPVLGSAASDISLVTSSDHHASITIPEGWSKDSGLASGADIQASHPSTEDYIVVLREDRSGFSPNTTINDYSKLVSSNMKEAIQNAKQEIPEQITIGGLTALQYVITGEVDKVKISYLVTIIASKDHFTQVLMWTRSDLFEAKKQNYLYIVNTFREL
ncbi:hypothetical protein AWM70_13735 [Paenibacillus yonginensis]|uniref:PsbP C-terminal domain-containing protein n=1 Tax=Paenibacillus yonginensis TaxID=1462996 RepID=A0A1B1N290_9BACL|nr:hypothetical protein [Paenibacillus yonginensis]ANS75528.1 hypothetical protein AWM70_13735 [Paenibacillus yonginensis]